MKSKYTKKELIEKLKPYWIKVEKAQEKFRFALDDIQYEMSKATGIKDLEISITLIVDNPPGTIPTLLDSDFEEN